MALKFKVTGTRTVCGTEPGGSFSIEEDRARPGYVGKKKKDAESGVNIPALLLANLVEPADASTKKWASELEGSQFATQYGAAESEGDSTANA